MNYVKAGKHEFKWKFRKFKEGLKWKKKVLEYHQTGTLPEPKMAPQVGGQLFGARIYQFLISNSNFKKHQVFKISFFHKFN